MRMFEIYGKIDGQSRVGIWVPGGEVEFFDEINGQSFVTVVARSVIFHRKIDGGVRTRVWVSLIGPGPCTLQFSELYAKLNWRRRELESCWSLLKGRRGMTFNFSRTSSANRNHWDGIMRRTRGLRTASYLFVSLLAFFCSNASADDSCDKVLDDGVRDKLHYEDVSKFRLDLNRLVRLSEQDLRSHRASGGISVPIADFLIKAGAESSDVRDYKRLLEVDERLAADSYHFRRIQAEVVSRDLLDGLA